MADQQTTTATFKNSEVSLIKRGLSMLDSCSLGFEQDVARIYEKLKPMEITDQTITDHAQGLMLRDEGQQALAAPAQH